MSQFKAYRRKGVTMMRPYVDGEDLTGVSVSDSDIPAVGGMIAVNENIDNDRWYIAEQWFKDNYYQD